MSKIKILPRVVLVGRVNAGKSTLFNRLSTQVKALVHDTEGVTRDPLYDVCSWQGKDFILIDTAGIYHHHEDALYKDAFGRTVEEIKKSDVIVVVLDGRESLSTEDYRFLEMLRKQSKPVVAAINKVDNYQENDLFYEVMGLGFESVFKISASHGKGVEDLLEGMLFFLSSSKKSYDEEEFAPLFQVALIGRPNVGKSSLMNALVKHERSLVSDVPGTTREAVLENIKFFQNTIQLVDTAGVRRSRAIDEDLEKMMVSNTMHALKDAQIVLLVLDAQNEHIADQDIKLAYYAFADHYKALMVLWNKVDLLQEAFEEKYEHVSAEYKHFFGKVSSLGVSCLTGKNIGKILPLVHELWGRYSQEINSEEVHRLFIQHLEKTPLMHKKERLELHRAYVLQTAPPTIFLEVNEPLWFGDSQRAFFENILRRNFSLSGVPVKFVIRKK